MDIVKELLKTAKKDFQSSIKLYEVGHFNMSLFQLQQSVEKFVKSFGIATEVIEEKDLQQKISHLPHKVFARLFKKKVDDLEQLKKPFLMQEMVPPHQRSNDDNERIKQLKKSHLKTSHLKLEEMAKIDSDEINEFLNGIEEIEKFDYDESTMFVKIKDDLIKTQEHFKSYFTNYLKEDKNSPALKLIELVLNNPDEFAKQKMIEHKYQQSVKVKINYLFYVWANLSILTAPHEQTTRYPSSETGKSPDDYDENHLLIKYYPKFKPLMEKSIEIYEELIENGEINASL